MNLKGKILLIIIILLLSLQPVLADDFNSTLHYIKVPAGQENIQQPVQAITMTVNVIFKVNGDFKWSQPQGWSYIEKFMEGENRNTYQVTMSQLNLIKPDELAITFNVRMRVAPPTTSAPFHPSWNENLDLPEDMKKIAKAFASTSETYYDYMYKVYDFVSHYITYDDSWITKDPNDINELWQNRRGVCRHYTMLMKAFFDYAGIDSLYALGFLAYNANNIPVVGVHMWIYAYDPANGWIMFDPTNNLYGQFNEHGYTYTYTLNLPVKITDEYVPYIYLPIYDVSLSKVQETYTVSSYDTIGNVEVQELVLQNDDDKTYFIRTIGAGNIFYVPLPYYKVNDQQTDYYKVLSQYDFLLIPEYTPEKYIVPTGVNPDLLKSFYSDLYSQAEQVDFNKYFTIQYDTMSKEVIIQDNAGSDLQLFLTTDDGRFVTPVKGKSIYKYDLNNVGSFDNLNLYFNVFGQLMFVKSFKVDIKSLKAMPIITIPVTNGFQSIIKVQTTPDLGEKLKDYLTIDGATITKWYDNQTFEVITDSDTITIRVGVLSQSVDLYDTGIQIVSHELEFKNSQTILHLQYNTNVGELLNKYSLTPLYIRVGEKDYPITYSVDKDKIDLTASLSMEVFMNKDYTYYFLTRQSSVDILKLDYSYDIDNLYANYDGSTITIVGTLTIHPHNFKFDEQSLEDFSVINIDNIQPVGTAYKVQFHSQTISPLDFTNPYTFNVNIFGEDIKLTYVFTVIKPKISKVNLLKYEAGLDTTKLYFIMVLSYSSANANQYMVNYMFSQLLNYAKVNNYKYPAKYLAKQNYLIGVTAIPTQTLLKMSQLSIFGVNVQNSVDYTIDKNYLSPKLVFKTLPLIGKMTCSQPYTLNIENGNFELMFSIQSVYDTIECEIGTTTITIKPEVPYLFTTNLIDTSRIDDVKDSNTLYAGYDEVYLSITTTAIGSNFVVFLDNKTLTTIQEGSAKVALPKLSVGTHTLSIQDTNKIEVYRQTITVLPQPLPLKIMHNFILIIIIIIVFTLIIVVKVMGQEDPLVEQAKILFPNTEFLQKEQYGDWTYIYLMDDLRGEVITVMFNQGRVVNVTRNRLF